MGKRLLGALVIFIGANLSTNAIAQVAEVRGGLIYHNIGIVKKQGGKEKGPDIEGQVIFNQLESLTWLAKPRPIVALNLNLAGETSFAAIGLNWDIKASENWVFSPSFGYSVHNADPLTNPYTPAQSVPRQKFDDEELALGSRDLFWTSLAFGRRISDDTKVFIAYEHLSHGQVLGKGVNQALDNIGIYWAKEF